MRTLVRFLLLIILLGGLFIASRRPVPAAVGASANTKARISAETAVAIATSGEIGPNDFRISRAGIVPFGAGNAAVAYNSQDNEYLVVWHGDDNTGILADNEYEIFGQRVDAASGQEVGPDDFRISDMGVEGSPYHNVFDPAVAYNSRNNQYLVVWYGDDSKELVDREYEIYGQVLEADGADTEPGTHFRISDMGIDGDNAYRAYGPAAAYDPDLNQFLVVWYGNESFDQGDNAPKYEIYGQLLRADGSENGSNDFRISFTGPANDATYQARSPAVVYNSSRKEYMVVWTGRDDETPLAQDENEIFGQRIDAAAGQLFGFPVRLSDMGPDGDEEYDAYPPTVAYNPELDQYLVVWRGDDNTPPLVQGEFEIFGQLLAGDGSEIGPNDFRISDIGPDGNPSYIAFLPAVVFNPARNEYLVLWAGDEAIGAYPGAFVTEVYGQRIDAASGQEVGSNDFGISDMGAGGGNDYSAFYPKVAYNAGQNEYFVPWIGNDAGGELDDGELGSREYETFGQLLAADGTEIGEDDILLSNMGTDRTYDAYSPSVAYNTMDNEYLVVWHADTGNTYGNDTLADEEFEIYGQRVDAATGDEVGLDDFRISFMGPDGDAAYDAYRPAVAYDSVLNQYLVVWWADDNSNGHVNGAFEIYGQLLEGDGTLIDDDFRISTMGEDNGDPNYDAYTPHAVYNPTAELFLVVWHGRDEGMGLASNEYEIFGQIVYSGGDVINSQFVISDAQPDGELAYRATRATAAYNSTDNQFLVVWEGSDGSAGLAAGEREIFGQLLSADGMELGTDDFRISEMGPDGNADFDAHYPAAAYDPVLNQYLVVWEGNDDRGDLANEEDEIFGQLLAASGTETGPNDFRVSDMGQDGDPDFGAHDPAVTYNPDLNQYLVVWEGSEDFSGSGNPEVEIIGQWLNPDATEAGENDFRLSDMGLDGDVAFTTTRPSMACQPDSDRCLAVWSGDDDSGTLIDDENEIFGQFLGEEVVLVVQADSYTVPPDTMLVVPAPGVLENDTGIAGDSLTAVRQSIPSHGALFFNADGSFTYIPDSGFAGVDSFTYYATAGLGTSAPATVTLEVGSPAPEHSVYLPAVVKK